MGDKINGEYFVPATAAFNYNNLGGGADSGGGSGSGSGMECLPQPGPYLYLISEQAKSLVALQNEVGALLEFRDLVIETFPNLRSKLVPGAAGGDATNGAGGGASRRSEWEPGVRVRRKIGVAVERGVSNKPQPSVQDSGFSTETSCKDASRSRHNDDELVALLDIIQRKGVKVREEAEQLRLELEATHLSEGAEQAFKSRVLSRSPAECACSVLRDQRDDLLARAAAAAAVTESAQVTPPRRLGRLDATLRSTGGAHVPAPDSQKIAAVLQETDTLELQRQLLTALVTNQMLEQRVKRGSEMRARLLSRLQRERDTTDDLRFRLEEKTAELESSRVSERTKDSPRKSVGGGESVGTIRHSSMKDMEPLTLGESPAAPRRRPSRIPLHKPRPPAARSPAPRPPSAHSARSASSARSRPPTNSSSRLARSTQPDKVRPRSFWIPSWFTFKDS